MENPINLLTLSNYTLVGVIFMYILLLVNWNIITDLRKYSGLYHQGRRYNQHSLEG